MTYANASDAPGPQGTCRVCGRSLQGKSKCDYCGATYGEANRCPHCRAIADVEPSDAYRFRCRVCGGARVPVDDPAVVRTGREVPALQRAVSARRKSKLLRIGGAGAASFGLVMVLLTAAVVGLIQPGLFLTVVPLLLFAVPLVLGLVAMRRGRKHAQAAQRELDAAWSLAASDVLAAKGGELTAEGLSRIMRISPTQAEQLLSELHVHDFVHARVTDEGDLAYSVRPERVRVTETDAELEELEALTASTGSAAGRRGGVV